MKPETVQRILKFSSDRDWDQFHTPANLAKSISIEANELLADPACDSAGTLSALWKLRLRVSGQRSGKKVTA